ncbi:uncharacterized protein LOC106670478 isoform X3 [Cimex lectularius]|uniref:Resistance to inhibitors of cholinesterase protein 3 N-terminal domain-containing protein n=1 Tax=Cimex lectularius TaxID=79782 RepID=A0A8I6SS98_CIMLE|nr:uncharacterized protein LOC106670478 isoform X3 [Cimex lectularius]
MATEFGTGKSIFILAIVAGCFAILWPNIFYPMIVGNTATKGQQASNGNGCCDVIFDTDVNAIKLMTELCERILSRENEFDKKFLFAFQQGKLTKEIVHTCQKTVLDKCDVDITEFLNEKVLLGKSYKQMLDEIRSLNSSLCLKRSFGISFKQIGLPRTVRIWGINQPKHLRQERPPHLHPEFLHPALREKGRAIPQSHVVPKIKQQEGRPGPLPGIRPPMGGAGHVVPPPKGSGTMGIVMPMYTIGIVVFFLYTMMKILFKKSDSTSGYEGFSPDPDFQRVVFGERVVHKGFANGKESEDTTKLGRRERDTIVSAITGLVEEVNRQIRSDEAKLPYEKKEKELEKEIEHLVDDEVKSLDKEEFEEEVVEEEEAEDTGKGVVKVLGMEMTESCEKGAKWSRPPTPLSRPTTPQNIYISGAVPSQSQLLVSDSHTETIPAEDHAVVLTGKVTLSLIGLENEEGSAYKVSSSDQLSENKKDKTECETGLNSDEHHDSFGSEDSSKLTEIENKKTNISADEHEEIKETKDLSATNTDEFDVEGEQDDLEEEYEEEVEEEEDFESNEGKQKHMET